MYREPWAWPAYVGVYGGTAMFLACLLPILVIQYRRYGDLNVRRLVGAAGLSIFLVALFAYTMLPAPPRTGDWCEFNGGHGWQLVPFSSFVDAYEATRGTGWRATLINRMTLQIVFNVLLFVPLGIWCRRFFEHGILAATAIGFGVSLLIETTQATGVWGLWPCSYRFPQVDDLITNTFGALLGAATAWLFLFWMPQSSRLERSRLTPRPVTVFRRWLGMVLDLVIVASGWLLTAMAARVAVLMTDHKPRPTPLPLETVATYAIPTLALVYLPALVGSGASIGQRLVWLTPRWSGRATIVRRLLRATVSPGLAMAFAVAAATGPERFRGPAAAVATAILLVSVLAAALTRDHRGLSGVISGADIVDSRVGRATPEPRADLDGTQPRV